MGSRYTGVYGIVCNREEKIEMENKNQLLVSIGVPVFNGEKGLAVALDSLIAQNYPNLEIIISDNASTDNTPEICAEYVRKDHRFRYYRSEKNRGMWWNFNRVFELSSGKYFMWAAHDDQREPLFVTACVEKMENSLNAVLCHVQTAMLVEGEEEVVKVTHLDSFKDVKSLTSRYKEGLKNIRGTMMYALFRSSALRKTKLFRRSIASDMAFLQELSIYGEFVQVSKILFSYEAREKWNTVDQDYYQFIGKKKKPWWYSPFVVLFVDHWIRVYDSTVPIKTKLFLWSILIKYEVVLVTRKVFIKLAGWLCPDRWKERLGCAIYWKWMSTPNDRVVCESLFLKRAIKPTLGWWR